MNLPPHSTRQLPVSFFPEAKIGLDEGVPVALGEANNVLSDGAEAVPGRGLTLVIRDPIYINHYFHFLEIFIGLFSFHQEYLGELGVERIIFGRQNWNNAQQNNVQEQLIRAVYGGIDVFGTEIFQYGMPRFKNVLCIDRALAVTGINKFLEPLLPEARRWMPEFRRRVYAATRTTEKAAVHDPRQLRCAYIPRRPPRTLGEEDRTRLLSMLKDRFADVIEVDFGRLSWRQQVLQAAQIDLLVGVHGNGLSNLLWLPRHGTAIEIFPPDFHAFDYQVMAEIAGLSYFGMEGVSQGYVYTEGSRAGAAYGEQNQPVKHLPIEALEHALDGITQRSRAGGDPPHPS
jgi:hypothetical protein